MIMMRRKMAQTHETSESKTNPVINSTEDMNIPAHILKSIAHSGKQSTEQRKLFNDRLRASMGD
jgi:hypothetical protein